jgi:translation initiation factor 1
MPDNNSRLVYSTDSGRVKPAAEKISLPRPEGPVRVRFEKSGRKGKGATIISGLPLDGTGMESLAKELKQKLGTGGTVRDWVIELQGDLRRQAAEELRRRGYQV